MSTPKKSNPFHFWAIMRSRYYQLLNKSTSGPYKLENQGISHARNGVRGNVLSIDLCPSSRDFEKPFFERLLALQKGSSKPIPLAISISGLWLLQHPKEFQWLLAEEKANHFAITWVNHSFSHVFYQDLPETDNFLLKTPGNLETELLLTEKYLLEAGEIPSVFIRFPGLVSNKTLVHTVKEYGLIPLGADAWLAKDQAIKPGSIILIHGNGNEHGGIKRLLPELQSLWIVDLRMVV